MERKSEEKPFFKMQRSISENSGKGRKPTRWKELGIQFKNGDTKETKKVCRTPDTAEDYVDFQTIDKVRVICRFRPPNMKELREEKQNGLEQVDPVISGQALTVSRLFKKGKSKHSSDSKTFYLDATISWDSSQNRCFRVVGFPMVESVLAGYNATIFAYGQTGSGKTYTMFGPEGNVNSPSQVGIIQRALSLLFKTLSQRKDPKLAQKYADRAIEDYTVKIQFVQIYREQLHDLLNPRTGGNLRIRFDQKKNAPYIENITQNVVHDTKDVLKLTKIAISNRITDSTGMNATSSRSHLVMTIMVEQNKTDGTKVSSKLNFGDLAGSESIRKTGIKLGSKQLEELKAINLSLTKLTTVINDIVNGRGPSFRSSKLTYLLQDSLGGNTKTTVVVCCSPHIYNRDETIRTLNFAQNAKSIKIKAKVNREYTKAQLGKMIAKLEAENERLNAMVTKLEGQMKLGSFSGDILNNAEYKKLLIQIADLEEQITNGKAKWSESVEEMGHKLRLKDIALDAAHVQIQKLQEESVQDEDKNNAVNRRILELESEIDDLKARLEESSIKNENLRLTMENLDEQFQEKAEDLKVKEEKISKLGSILEIKKEEIISKDLMIKDLNRHNETLSRKLKDEERIRKQAEQAETELISHVRTLTSELDQSKMQSIQKEVEDSEEVIVLKKHNSEEIMEKYQLDEEVLSEIEKGLKVVLHKWQTQHTEYEQPAYESDSWTLVFQFRKVSEYFNLAMLKIKEQRRSAESTEAEIKRLRETIEQLKAEISNLKAQNKAIKQTNESLQEEVEEFRIMKAEKRREANSLIAAKESDAKFVQYLEKTTSTILKGDDPDKDQIMLKYDTVLNRNVLSDSEDGEEGEVMAPVLSTGPNGAEWRQALKKGDLVDALDPLYLWYSASVVEVRKTNRGDDLLIHYKGFDKNFDEWIYRYDLERLAKIGTKAEGGKESGGTESCNAEVKGEKKGEWYVTAGWMWKRSVGLIKRSRFQKRYFVLFANGFLKYYLTDVEDEPIGAINVCLVKEIQMETADWRKSEFEFTLQEARGLWTLRVNTQEEMNMWISAVRNIRVKVTDTVTSRWLQKAAHTRRDSGHQKTDKLLVRRRSRQVLLSPSNSVNGANSTKNLSNASSSHGNEQANTKKEIHKGFMWKLGGNVHNWRKRYFVAYNNHTISYFDGTDPDNPMRKKKNDIDIWGVMEIKELTDDEKLIVKLPSECVTGLRVDTNSRKWIFGMESFDDLEVWTKVISENCIFSANFSEAGESLPKERCGSFERRRSSGWSNVKKSVGGVISKTMGLSRGLKDDVFTFHDDKIIHVNPNLTNKEDTESESDWKTGDNLLDLDTIISVPLQSWAPPPSYKAPVKPAPVLKKASRDVSVNSDTASPVKSAPVPEKASTNGSTNCNEPEMPRHSSFNDIAPRKRGHVSSIKELKFGEDPLTADVKNELRALAPHARTSSEPLLFPAVEVSGDVRPEGERTKSSYKFIPLD